MTGQIPIIEERPVLLQEDLWYAIKQLSSIIKDDGYVDLGNHATEAMGETDLFNLAQVCLFDPFLCTILLLSSSNLCF